MPESNLNFITEAPRILGLLEQSKEGGTCIAIKAAPLGTDIVVTAVDAVMEEDGRHKVILKHCDTTGYILPTNKLYLDEIAAVCPFSTPFRNPIQDHLDKEKPWFF